VYEDIEVQTYLLKILFDCCKISTCTCPIPAPAEPRSKICSAFFSSKLI